VGLLAGFIGSRKVLVTCLKCGIQWQPGSEEEAAQRAAGKAADQYSAAKDQQLAANLIAEQARWEKEQEVARQQREVERQQREQQRNVKRQQRWDAQRRNAKARGINPDAPLLWFRLLPDTVQAIAIGLILTVPVVAILVIILSHHRP
jgi:hypothetical protein